MMAKASDAPRAAPVSLAGLERAVRTTDAGRPPVHLWNPPFCGDIDMRVARDGTWFYGGTPIGRPALVKLFSSVLRREGDKFLLVTPVEKVGITVEDAPFTGVELAFAPAEDGPVLRVRTNVDEWVTIDAAHPLRFEPGAAEGLKPYLHVRDDLWALLRRPVFYEIVERGEARTIDGNALFGIASAGTFFPMAPADAIGFEP
jgi:uncharacterized protein